MTTIKASETRIPPRIFGEVAFKGERVRITKNGSEEIYLVSKEDIEILRKLEDRYWAETAQEVIDEAKAGGEKPVPWDYVKKELGL